MEFDSSDCFNQIAQNPNEQIAVVPPCNWPLLVAAYPCVTNI